MQGLRWNVVDVRRGVRDRSVADAPRPLELLAPADRKLLQAWVRDDSATRAWPVLLKLAGRAEIERAEALCQRLLEHGWLVRRELLKGGSWQWERITWRDLEGLKALVGVGSRKSRSDERGQLLVEASAWLAQCGIEGSGLHEEIGEALAQLGADGAIPLEVVRARLGLLRALVQWEAAGLEGLRRNFALHAVDHTKAMGVADWRWLERHFDLERLRIAQFAPMLWLAGPLRLHWGGHGVDVQGLHCIALPLPDVARVDRVDGAVQRYWLLENRASFERQAQQLPPGCCLLWLPGRPTHAWLEGVRQLLRLAPAPAWISADADPAGVDIALTAGRLWESRGLAWQPHRMGVAELAESTQAWPLNAHDRTALARLLANKALPPALRALCEAMQADGRKAEQEGWL